MTMKVIQYLNNGAQRRKEKVDDLVWIGAHFIEKSSSVRDGEKIGLDTSSALLSNNKNAI